MNGCCGAYMKLKQCNNSHKAYMYTIQTWSIDKLLNLD